MSNEIANQGSPVVLPPVLRRNIRRRVLICLCIFICGVLIGPVVMRFVMWPHGHPPGFGGPGPGNIEERAHDASLRMRDDLDLTDEQTEQIYDIMRGNFSALEDNLRKSFADMSSKIRTILNKEQIIKYDEWMNKRFEKFMGPPGKDGQHERFRGPLPRKGMGRDEFRRPPPGEDMKDEEHSCPPPGEDMEDEEFSPPPQEEDK